MFAKIRVRWAVLLLEILGIFSTFADVVGPTMLYRLQRVGYEVLNDGAAVDEEFSFWVMNEGVLWRGACCVCVVGLILSFKKVRLRIWNLVHRCLNWCKRKWEYVVLGVLFVSAVVGAGYVLKQQVFDALLVMGYGKIHASGPGWRYPDQVPDKVRGILMGRLNAVKDDLQKAVDSSGLLMEPAREPYWQVTKPHYERESLSILTRVLSESEGLRHRCKGIPIEWLREHIRFTVREASRNDSRMTGGIIGEHGEPQ